MRQKILGKGFQCRSVNGSLRGWSVLLNKKSHIRFIFS